MLQRLVGVVAARVKEGGPEGMASVEVLAEGPRAPMQVVADVRSLLYTHFRMAIPPEHVKVALIGDGRDLGPLPRRLRLVAIRYRVDSQRRYVEVELSSGQRRICGFAEKPQGILSMAPEVSLSPDVWLAATATLRAIEEACGHALALRLEDVRSVEVAARPVVLVAVGLIAGGREEGLLGASAISDDPLAAAARAALDAVNRRVTHAL